jgi:hypothetical protein
MDLSDCDMQQLLSAWGQDEPSGEEVEAQQQQQQQQQQQRQQLWCDSWCMSSPAPVSPCCAPVLCDASEADLDAALLELWPGEGEEW